MLHSWEAVKLEITQIINSSSEPFDPATIQNAEKFIHICRDRVRTPIGVAKGYWSTICIVWDGIEVEILDDRYELYGFADGATSIEYFDAGTREDIPEKLIERLPCLKIED